MKTLIIYYSDSGSTKVMARTLSMHLKADIIGIKDLKNRKGFANRLLSSVDAFRESKTEISPEKLDLTDYDLIYIGTPTWAGKPTPAIITLIDRCNWTGKDVILFTTMTKDGSEETTLERLDEKVSFRGARVVESFSLNTKDKSPEDIINDTEGIIQTLVLKMYSGA
ncbi:MAG: NAD(P)H-dependent oxidoreductase [Methanobrevibacter sp.]|uniref:Flavodoxin n=1 Tax=Methanobrevibacter millerae TaxID=230361 RepID=A0A8T3VLD1_9EURY|nr:flavodoxin [Methanobrevibacter millerae]MBE6504994.1 flavodoxin [Methanobrevibacter millerae]MBQ6630487.1 NAD(P)H-dependent oxidoreductase [Methanobrevibacter sp.]MBR0059263.1 NAD(P)H-dependent oxidoreductase [Methanobrevibacter sp.]MBR0370807.1 NAD(P)H-dependent oxidoreductase [Methanobrevibacter sp.]